MEIFNCPKCNNSLIDDSANKYLLCSKCNIYYKANNKGQLFELKWKGPNSFSENTRLYCFIISICLTAYGVYGLAINDIYIRGKRGPGMHFHNLPALIIFIAMISAVLCMISIIVDHFDKRNNEIYYKVFRKITIITTVICYIVSFILQACVDLDILHQ